MTISQRIFELLKEKHRTQKELSEYTGISPAAISSWKSKNTNPSADKIVKIAEFFKVSPIYLLTGSSTLPKDSGETVLLDTPDGYQTGMDTPEHRMLHMFRSLDRTQQGHVLAILEAMLNGVHVMK